MFAYLIVENYSLQIQLVHNMKYKIPSQIIISLLVLLTFNQAKDFLKLLNYENHVYPEIRQNTNVFNNPNKAMRTWAIRVKDRMPQKEEVVLETKSFSKSYSFSFWRNMILDRFIR